ncbi:MAG: tetratricopeptide repeat protein [Magnetococcales bacterium]|nr:tetratricopeptide repeat protein [Magnetococcales bacterium]
MTTEPMTPLAEQLRHAAARLRAGEVDGAEAEARTLLEAHPGHPHVLHLRGLILLARGHVQGAAAHLARAIAAAPAEGEFHLALARVLQQQGRSEPARERAREAARRLPEAAEPWVVLGDLAVETGAAEEAAACYEEGIARQPEHWGAWNNLGLIRKTQGRLEEAEEALRRATALLPGEVEGWVNLAQTLLLAGRYPEGWAAYERRLELPMMRAYLAGVPPGLPRWRGEVVPGARLLLVGEQGYGDTLQFVRFLPGLRAAGMRLRLLCAPELMELLAFNQVADEVAALSRNHLAESVAAGAAGCDAWLPLASLPGILGVSAAAIPAPIPYLRADPDLLPPWRERRLRDGGGAGLVVGLSWQGTALHGRDPARRRSCRLAELAPLAQAAPGALFVSLQQGEGADQAADPPPGMRLVDWSGELREFSDTAAALESLDLVVTIDTALAHLAGAMVKEGWVLLPFAPDWRWGLTGDSAGWHPTLRLFRQSSPGDWTHPIRRIAERLRMGATG